MRIASRLGPAADHPGIGLSGLIPGLWARAAVSLAGLAGTLWATVAALPADPGIITPAFLAVAALAWAALSVCRRGPLVAAIAVTMGAAGAVVAVTDSNGLIFVGVAAGTLAVSFEAGTALVLAASGPLAYGLTALAHGSFPGRLVEAAAAGLAGLVGGASRREIDQRARHSEQVATERQRAEVAKAEAALAGERNRLGRELHDVLAHTLGALSIQLTAIDTLARSGADREKLLTQIELGHELVSTGLDEAREAVHALRGDSTPLTGQLARLCELHRAALDVAGTQRRLDADTTLALYRVAQEALTNAAKHAPDAPVTVLLAFEPREVSVRVSNAPPNAHTPSPLHTSGGGFGLKGMRERVEQAGGEFQAGSGVDGGWQVAAAIPYREQRTDPANRPSRERGQHREHEEHREDRESSR